MSPNILILRDNVWNLYFSGILIKIINVVTINYWDLSLLGYASDVVVEGTRCQVWVSDDDNGV